MCRLSLRHGPQHDPIPLHVRCLSQITSYKLHWTLSTVAVSGPTWDSLPPFRFSTSAFANVTHLGIPDEVKFNWGVIEWRP